jgi:predicted kinase
MKFIESSAFTSILLTSDDGTEYRTSPRGTYWERLYGQSWEPVYGREEAECSVAFNEWVRGRRDPASSPGAKTAYIMVGVPGSGKSTWIDDNNSWTSRCNVCVVSTDEFVEEYAASVGKTYSEVFQEYMPTAVELMAAAVVKAREAGCDVVWDQTSLTVASRRKKFRMLPGYRHIAVVVQTPEPEELRRRLASRPGKNIPWEVVERMMDQFEMPTEEEGYSEVWIVAN